MDDSFERKFCIKSAFCRLCFSQNNELHRIFPPCGAPNQVLILKLEYCTGIGLSFSADSNASICVRCIRLTEKLFRFKQLCVANERWLKMDSGSACVDHELVPSMIMPPTVTEDRMERADSYGSLLTIGTEQLEEDYPDRDEEHADQEWSSNPAIQDKDASTDESSSEGHLQPSIKVTIRLTPEMKSYLTSSTAFSLIPGTKSRAGRLYLVYKGYHYSDYQSKKNVYRCTQRAPVYCRAKVLLKKGRVYEINDNAHDHPMPRKSWSRRIKKLKE